MTKPIRLFSRLTVFIPSLVVILTFQTLGQPTVLAQPQQPQQGQCQTFPETGKMVCDKFLSYWQGHGGLAQQGFPISGEFQERSDVDGKVYTVQYFERAVFELHPENATPNDVLLSLLGSLAYKQKYPNGATELPPPANPVAGMVFPQTGKEIRGEFLTYWKEHGGLQQQGYPITNLMLEKSELDGKQYTVQYFERAVFESHPENTPPYNVLLSQLGTLRFNHNYPPYGYGHAQDYSRLVGQLKQQGSCWVVTYVSPLLDIAADQYNNQLALLPGASWNLADVKDGEWVVVYGQPESGTAPAPGCAAHGYTVATLQPNPNATGGTVPAAYPSMGHAADYSWIAGQVGFTRIQGGCTFIYYDNEASVQPFGQGWSAALAAGQVTQGAYIVAFGHMAGPNEPAPMCPAKAYVVDQVRTNPTP